MTLWTWQKYDDMPWTFEDGMADDEIGIRVWRTKEEAQADCVEDWGTYADYMLIKVIIQEAE